MESEQFKSNKYTFLYYRLTGSWLKIRSNYKFHFSHRYGWLWFRGGGLVGVSVGFGQSPGTLSRNISVGGKEKLWILSKERKWRWGCFRVSQWPTAARVLAHGHRPFTTFLALAIAQEHGKQVSSSTYCTVADSKPAVPFFLSDENTYSFKNMLKLK